MTNAKQAGPVEDGRVAVPLAHPLGDKDKKALYLDLSTETEVGSIIVLTKDQAVSLMNAGFVQVDMDDPEAVKALFDGKEPVAAVEQPTPPVDNAPVDDSTKDAIAVAAPQTAEGTGGESMDPPQPGADADGFGGDAPAPAEEPPAEEPVVKGSRKRS